MLAAQSIPHVTLSPNFAPVGDVMGCIQPRIWTPPLRELTPETSYGFDVINFARDVLCFPLDPWQQWLVIHAGELLPDGTPRFRKILVLVSRQNGKTQLLAVMAAYWMFVEAQPLIIGTSNKTEKALEAWQKMIDLVQATEALRDLRESKWYSTGAGREVAWTNDGSRYKAMAANENGGRGDTIHRLIADELRKHRDNKALNASVPAMNAVSDAQAWFLSNAGNDNSKPLNAMRESAIEHLKSGEGNDQLAIFEWSAPEGSSPTDIDKLAMANPNLGYRMNIKNLLGDARAAEKAGGSDLADFQNEYMCIRTQSFDNAINPEGWAAGIVAGDLEQLLRQSAFCVDVSKDHRHVTLCAAAALPDGRTRVQVVATWEGEGATKKMRAELPFLVRKLKPRALGWFPMGPAAAIAAELTDRKGRFAWPPPGVVVEEIRAEAPAVCMGFAEQVENAEVVHSDEAVLTMHVTTASKWWMGDRWTFYRKGEGHCDGAYAAAGAVHLARIQPPPIRKGKILSAVPQ